ncbi:MAG: beta-lactamase family protein [Chloroflexota bacterium]|nr:beta-lactamase family protein [Chloroflexota bacterium]
MRVRLKLAALVLVGVSFASQASTPAALPQEGADLPITGAAAPSMAALDVMMSSLMQKWQLPGGELAVAKDGRLVFAHGYGYADQDAGTTVQPDALFRIASVSKVFTATAILTLVDNGQLSLDAPAFDLLNIQPPAGATLDPRVASITVRELLQHTAGFDRTVSGDPMSQVVAIASATGVPPPADCPTIVRYMLGQPLDFDPGTRFAYSNFGYCALGQVIEAVTRMSYGDFVRESVMRPAGITRMALGRTFESDRLPGEVTYYDYSGAPLVPSVYPSVQGQVAAPYGGFSMEGRESSGGWIASTVDLVKLSTGVVGRRGPPLLQPDTSAAMVQAPAFMKDPSSMYISYTGLGWDVRRPDNGGVDFSKAGNFPGTFSYVVHLANGWDWAVVFNSQPKDVVAFGRVVDAQAQAAIDALAAAPSGDLFPQLP